MIEIILFVYILYSIYLFGTIFQEVTFNAMYYFIVQRPIVNKFKEEIYPIIYSGSEFTFQINTNLEGS